MLVYAILFSYTVLTLHKDPTFNRLTPLNWKRYIAKTITKVNNFFVNHWLPEFHFLFSLFIYPGGRSRTVLEYM